MFVNELLLILGYSGLLETKMLVSLFLSDIFVPELTKEMITSKNIWRDYLTFYYLCHFLIRNLIFKKRFTSEYLEGNLIK